MPEDIGDVPSGDVGQRTAVVEADDVQMLADVGGERATMGLHLGEFRHWPMLPNSPGHDWRSWYHPGVLKRVLVIVTAVMLASVGLMALFGGDDPVQQQAAPKAKPLTELANGQLFQDVGVEVTRQRYSIIIDRYRFLGLHNAQADAAVEIRVRRDNVAIPWKWVESGGFTIQYGAETRPAKLRRRGEISTVERKYDIVLAVLPSNELLNGCVALTVAVPGGPFSISPRPVIPPGTTLPKGNAPITGDSVGEVGGQCSSLNGADAPSDAFG